MVLGDGYVDCRLEDGSELGSCCGEPVPGGSFCSDRWVKRGYKHVTDKSRDRTSAMCNGNKASGISYLLLNRPSFLKGITLPMSIGQAITHTGKRRS